MATKLTEDQKQIILEQRRDVWDWAQAQMQAGKGSASSNLAKWWESTGSREYGSWDNFSSQPSAADRQRMTDLDAKAPDTLKGDPSWNVLSADQKEIAIYNYNVTLANDAAKAQALSSALEQAKSQAEPYWKEIIRVAQDELVRNIAGLEEDYATIEAKLQKKIGEINEDLTYNRDYLSTSKQAELGKQLDTYQQELKGIQAQAGATGLTSSSIRTDAERLSAKSNEYVVGSIQRDYDKQLRDLGVTSTRSVEDLEREIADLKTSMGAKETEAIRGAEKYLGTSNLPTLNNNTLGGTALGDITGTMYEDKSRDIELRKDAIYAELTTPSLQLTS